MQSSLQSNVYTSPLLLELMRRNQEPECADRENNVRFRALETVVFFDKKQKLTRINTDSIDRPQEIGVNP